MQFVQPTVYEFCPKFCSKCKKFGHLGLGCNGPSDGAGFGERRRGHVRKDVGKGLDRKAVEKASGGGIRGPVAQGPKSGDGQWLEVTKGGKFGSVAKVNSHTRFPVSPSPSLFFAPLQDMNEEFPPLPLASREVKSANGRVEDPKEVLIEDVSVFLPVGILDDEGPSLMTPRVAQSPMVEEKNSLESRDTEMKKDVVAAPMVIRGRDIGAEVSHSFSESAEVVGMAGGDPIGREEGFQSGVEGVVQPPVVPKVVSTQPKDPLNKKGVKDVVTSATVGRVTVGRGGTAAARGGGQAQGRVIRRDSSCPPGIQSRVPK